MPWASRNCMKRLNKGRRETKMNKKLVLAAIAREVNFWYDVSLKTDSDITREEAEKKIVGLHEAYFEIRGSKGHTSYVAGVDEEAGDIDNMYNLVLQRH